jgi:hypothetical protein
MKDSYLANGVNTRLYILALRLEDREANLPVWW